MVLKSWVSGRSSSPSVLPGLLGRLTWPASSAAGVSCSLLLSGHITQTHIIVCVIIYEIFLKLSISNKGERLKVFLNPSWFCQSLLSHKVFSASFHQDLWGNHTLVRVTDGPETGIICCQTHEFVVIMENWWAQSAFHDAVVTNGVPEVAAEQDLTSEEPAVSGPPRGDGYRRLGTFPWRGHSVESSEFSCFVMRSAVPYTSCFRSIWELIFPSGRHRNQNVHFPVSPWWLSLRNAPVVAALREWVLGRLLPRHLGTVGDTDFHPPPFPGSPRDKSQFCFIKPLEVVDSTWVSRACLECTFLSKMADYGKTETYLEILCLQHWAEFQMRHNILGFAGYVGSVPAVLLLGK